VVIVDRISEQLQPDAALLHRLTDAGLRPGRRATITLVAGAVQVDLDGTIEHLDRHVSDHIFVRTA